MHMYEHSVNKPAKAMRNPALVWECNPRRIAVINAIVVKNIRIVGRRRYFCETARARTSPYWTAKAVIATCTRGTSADDSNRR